MVCLLEAVVEVVKVAVLAALFKVVKVVSKVFTKVVAPVLLVLFSKDGVFRARQAGA